MTPWVALESLSDPPASRVTPMSQDAYQWISIVVFLTVIIGGLYALLGRTTWPRSARVTAALLGSYGILFSWPVASYMQWLFR